MFDEPLITIMNTGEELQQLLKIKETNSNSYECVIEVDYTADELAKVQKLRKHFEKNHENDVRNHLEAVKVLFSKPDYIVGSGGNHIWIHRTSNKYQRIIYIGSVGNCEMWQPKQKPNIIFP